MPLFVKARAKMKKIVNICGKKVALETNADLPRKYRQTFMRDIFVDVNRLVKLRIEEALKNEDLCEALTAFENIIYIMAKIADESIPDTIDEWLKEFDTFNMYELLPEVINLWQQENKTLVTPKKENEQ